MCNATLQNNIETNSQASERLSSWNSTESEHITDNDESSSLNDDVTETTPLRGAMASTQPYAKYSRSNSTASRKPGIPDQNTHAYHLKPESQVLLMRPEVLKLRKTSC